MIHVIEAEESSLKENQLTFRQLVLANLPQFLDLRGLARYRPLHDFNPSPHRGSDGGCVCRRPGNHSDHADSGILRSTVMHPVPQISQPGLEACGIVFMNNGSVRDHGRFPGNRSPFSCGVEEGNIHCRVGMEIVGFSRLGVGMEYIVDTAAFL